jgi:hypothetical protein
MERHHHWCQTASCAFAKHHLVSYVQFILECGDSSPNTTFELAQGTVQAYLVSTAVIANDANSLTAVTHAASCHYAEQFVFFMRFALLDTMHSLLFILP